MSEHEQVHPQPAQTDSSEIVVIKLGGSVLTRSTLYRRCARHLARQVRRHPDTHWVVVVSARFGATDRLERQARSIQAEPDPSALDLLWLTGELQSVATLTLQLHALGVSARALNAHQCGLLVACPDATHTHDVRVDPAPIRRHLNRHTIVVVPGFFARGPDDAVASLGRGGSDLTAVLLAAGLAAQRCELVKDVAGYFSKDPNRCADAKPLPRLTFAEALRMAAEGCDLVQPRALIAAADSNTPVFVRGIDPTAAHTIVSGAVEHGHEIESTMLAM